MGMRPYIKFSGLAGDASRPSYTVLPEDAAMASVPGWVMLIDPSYVVTGGAVDRARGVLASRNTSVDYGNRIGAFSGGQTAFDLQDSNFLSINPNVAFPLNAWSVVTVARPADRTGTSNVNNLITPTSIHSSPEIAPRIGWNIGGTVFKVSAGGQDSDASPTRLTYTPGTSYVGRDTLLITTFSTREGFRLYENGVLVASNASDKDVFTIGYAAGAWNVFFFGRGLFGMTGLLSIDLGWAENAGYRRAITNFLKTKYGIA